MVPFTSDDTGVWVGPFGQSPPGILHSCRLHSCSGGRAGFDRQVPRAIGAELRQTEQRGVRRASRLSSRMVPVVPGTPVFAMWPFGSESQSISPLAKAGEPGSSDPPFLNPALFKPQRLLQEGQLENTYPGPTLQASYSLPERLQTRLPSVLTVGPRETCWDCPPMGPDSRMPLPSVYIVNRRLSRS